MVDIGKIQYKVITITPAGEKIDITEIVTNLGWEEGERELAMRLSLKIYNAEYKGQLMSEIVHPLTPIFVYAIIDGNSQEVARGTVEKWSPTENSDGTQYIDLTAYDEALALRHHKENRYWSDGSTTKARICEIMEQWGIPYEYNGPAATHAKATIKNKYLSDIIVELLDDAKKKGAGVFFLRAKEGKIQIIPRGSNEDVYHFDLSSNLISTTDSFDASNTVTRIKVVGKADKEGHQAEEAIVDGNLETFGWRQEILVREQDKSLEDATKAAKEILKEKGNLARKTTMQAPDLPFLRKGDRIRVKSGTLQGYFFVKSVRHNAADMKMNLEITEDKDMNAANGYTVDSNSSSENT